MSTTNDGGPAFPVRGLRLEGCDGMSLRDYFAAPAPHRACHFRSSLRQRADAQDALRSQRNRVARKDLGRLRISR